MHNKNSPNAEDVTFFQSVLPIIVLFSIILYGLILRPLVFKQPAFPLEIVFILAATFTVAELAWLGFSWNEIQKTIIAKLSTAMPVFFILLTIGVLIGSWMVSGTIPMLVYYGLKTIHPTYLYTTAFLVCIVFSTLTGTSWGSVGSVGAVFIGIGIALGANLPMMAGAIIGGAMFGDKISPLSDTTNIAALACDVELYAHIKSLMYTTLPSTIVALTIYTVLGFVYPPTVAKEHIGMADEFVANLQTVFNFNPILLLPAVIIVYGSIRKKPTVPTMMLSTLTAAVLALIFQRFTLGDVMQSMYKGFNVSMAPWAGELSPPLQTLLNRGGLYSLVEAVVIAICVFTFIGAMSHVNAIERVVERVFGFAKSQKGTVIATLAATAATNSLTSNQSATSFIVGDAFAPKYDSLGLSRRVLSRSLEDTGAMLESLVPWTPTAVFFGATLGVAQAQYWNWQFLSLANIIIAPLFALLGIGLFQASKTKKHDKEEN
ncbi:MAG: Na+/H+ antiporter NhaC [Pyrinomonadaceae bacterium]